MTDVRLISWNVNGIRAIHKKGFLDWFNEEKADVVCLQETKAQIDQLPKKLVNIPDYTTFLFPKIIYSDRSIALLTLLSYMIGFLKCTVGV